MPETEKFVFGKKRTPCKSLSQEEQNGANFNSVAPSSEELRVPEARFGKKIVMWGRKLYEA